jgi:putative polyhydroxyalkanoate system protein
VSRIHIIREHQLGLPKARQLAVKWAQTAHEHLGMAWEYEEGDGADRLGFKRAGVHGALTVTADRFVLDARLGLLLAAFRHRIENEIVTNLDLLLAHEEPVAAFEQAVAHRAARKKGPAHRKT